MNTILFGCLLGGFSIYFVDKSMDWEIKTFVKNSEKRKRLEHYATVFGFLACVFIFLGMVV